MKIVAIAEVEGGPWVAPPYKTQNNGHRSIHAFLLDDGSVWDSWNGWRAHKTALPDWLGIPRAAIDATGWAESLFPSDLENKVPKQAPKA